MQENIEVIGNKMRSRVNGESYHHGRLEVPSSRTLRARSAGLARFVRELQLSEVVGNMKDLHTDPKHANAMFQAASQFNLLEMISPGITPEMGIARYEYDKTPGSACAVAARGGTIYRNYFAQQVLDATCEATFYTVLENYQRTGNSCLFLSLVGRGAYGNLSYRASTRLSVPCKNLSACHSMYAS